MSEKITLVECPRDAMQGLHDFIPTQQKIDYLNLLLKVFYTARQSHFAATLRVV